MEVKSKEMNMKCHLCNKRAMGLDYGLCHIHLKKMANALAKELEKELKTSKTKGIFFSINHNPKLFISKKT